MREEASGKCWGKFLDDQGKRPFETITKTKLSNLFPFRLAPYLKPMKKPKRALLGKNEANQAGEPGNEGTKEQVRRVFLFLAFGSSLPKFPRLGE